MYPRPKLPVPEPRPFPTKPRQLREGKRVTIAVGVLSTQGLVLAADTEESDGYLKTSQTKLKVITGTHMTVQIGAPGFSDAHPNGAAVIIGAGTSTYVDAASDQLMSKFFGHRDDEDAVVISAVSEALVEFYAQHVIPFASFPNSERPEFALLMGQSAYGSGRTRLFFTDKTTVQRCSYYKALGAGGLFAEMLLKRLYPEMGLSLKEAALLAAYVVFHTKESVPTCGKFTEIRVLHKGERMYVPMADILSIETLFRRYELIERGAFFLTFASRNRERNRLKQFDVAFKKFRKDVSRLKFRILRLTGDEDLFE